MKKLILFILLFVTLKVSAQQTYFTPAVPPSSLSFTPSFRFKNGLVDSLNNIYVSIGNKWYQVYTAAQANARFTGGGGGTSTGVNGLNGTTNIGLGGTLSTNTTIAPAGHLLYYGSSSFGPYLAPAAIGIKGTPGYMLMTDSIFQFGSGAIPYFQIRSTSTGNYITGRILTVDTLRVNNPPVNGLDVLNKTYGDATYQALLGFTSENVANKTATASTSTTTYPNWLGVENYVASQIPSVPVSSVFGRTGVVVAATNDYTFAQIGSKPTTVSGYGITDALTPTGTQSVSNKTFLPANTYQTGLGTAGTDSIVVKNSGGLKAIAANYYQVAGSYALQSTTISAGTGLSGGGSLATNRTLSADTTVLQTVLNFKPLGSTYWVPLTRTVAGFALSSNVTLATLTPGSTLTNTSGSNYNGSAGTTLDINLSNTNTWLAKQTFSAANISIAGVTPSGAIGTGNLVFSISPTITGTLTTSAISAGASSITAGVFNNTKAGAGAAANAGISITNSTAATVGTQNQYGLDLTWTYSAWNTGGTPAANQQQFKIEPRGITGSTTGGNVFYSYQNSGGGFVDTYQFGSNGTLSLLTGGLTLSTVGGGISIKEGTNATMGIGTLSGGTLLISNTRVTANSRIFLTDQGGTVTNLGSLYISARSAGTSFTVNSSNVLDASTFAWVIIEPAP